ncbi:MAG: MFS transporter [Synergistaceae bacterium]|jgi:GPH family glycoside/pentoside/hexuronide:cation symporter|nr:MFS transporter [Synergistaceae bacterium]
MENFTSLGRSCGKGIIAYSCANFGYNLLAITVSFFLVYYYTDIIALPTLAVTAILFAARFFDGAIDPFIGYYMDNRTTKRGKYRGYLYYWAAPSCAIFVLMFLPTPFKGYGLIMWCAAIYLLFCFSVSVIEVANLSLLATISDSRDRNLANTFKVTASILGVLTVSYLTFELAKVFGSGSEQKGFAIATIFFACVALASLMAGAENITERTKTGRNVLSFSKTISEVLKNRQCVFLYLMLICDQVGMAIKNQSAMYYLKYCISRQDIIAIFLLTGVLSAFLTQPVIFWASRYARTSRLMVAGYVGMAASMLAIWYSGDSIWMLLLGNVIYGMTSAFPANLVFVQAANLSDRMSCDRNISFSGIVNSLLGVASKIGFTIGGSAVALILYATSYIPNAAQSVTTKLGIQICFVGFTFIMSIASAIFAWASFRDMNDAQVPESSAEPSMS